MGYGWVAVLILEILAISALVVYMMKSYISFKRTPYYASVSAFIGWFLCFGIIFITPIDIVTTDHTLCVDKNFNASLANHTTYYDENEVCHEPSSYLPPAVLVVEWRLLYWGTFVLSWVIYPIFQTYSVAGEFSIWDRVKSAVKDNLILYGIMASVGVVAFVFILAVAKGQVKPADMITVLMSLANIYGLILITLLMGYGLVDIPRHLIRKASRHRTLTHHQVELAAKHIALDRSQKDLMKTMRKLKHIDANTRNGDPYREYIDVIVSKCPVDYEDALEADGETEINYAGFSDLHAEVISNTHTQVRNTVLYQEELRKAFRIEDIIAAKGKPLSMFNWSFPTPRTHRFAEYHDKAEKIWELYISTYFWIAIAAFCTLLSICVVWSEMTLVATKQLSPFYYLQPKTPGFGKQLYCFAILFYMAVCCYTTLFKIRIFNYYRLVNHQMTDALSIMFSANYLCRLAAPLAFNFLEFVVLTPNDISDFSFYRVMGAMNAFSQCAPNDTSCSDDHPSSEGGRLLGLIVKKFQIIFPILVALLCIATLLNFWKWLGGCCCIASLRSDSADEEKLVDQGATLLSEERAKKEGRIANGDEEDSGVKGAIRRMFGTNTKNKNAPKGAKYKAAAPVDAETGGKQSSKFKLFSNNNSAVLHAEEPKFEYKPGSISAMYKADGRLNTKALASKYRKGDHIELISRDDDDV